MQAQIRMPVGATFRVARHSTSTVADKTRKWIKCNSTHDEDNLDSTDAATVSGALQLTTASEGRTTMCEDAKLAKFGDTWNFPDYLVEQVRVNDRCVRWQCDLFVCWRCQFISKSMRCATTLPRTTVSPAKKAKLRYESTLVSKVASTCAITITATLGELTVVNNDDGNDAEGVNQTESVSTTVNNTNHDVKENREESRSRCCEALIQASSGSCQIQQSGRPDEQHACKREQDLRNSIRSS